MIALTARDHLGRCITEDAAAVEPSDKIHPDGNTSRAHARWETCAVSGGKAPGPTVTPAAT